MEQHSYASRLRYLDAADMDDGVVNFHNLDVRGPDAGKIGTIDGFIVDTQADRALYVVVDSGGWFTSQRFLLPVGHAQLTADGGSLHVDVTKESLSRYPEFEQAQFSDLSDEDLSVYETRLAAVCCPDDVIAASTSWPDAYRMRRHYTQPDWWRGGVYGQEPENTATRDAASIPDESPHFGGRAQPGDVLGIETGGERTGIGETAEDEDQRRREGIEAAPERHRQ